jgi:hypothetical protein
MKQCYIFALLTFDETTCKEKISKNYKKDCQVCESVIDISVSAPPTTCYV